MRSQCYKFDLDKHPLDVSCQEQAAKGNVQFLVTNAKMAVSILEHCNALIMYQLKEGVQLVNRFETVFTTDHVPDKLEPNTYEKFFINALSYTSPKAIDDLTIAFEEDESNDLIQNFQEIDLLDEHVFPDVIDYEFEEVILSPFLTETNLQLMVLKH